MAQPTSLPFNTTRIFEAFRSGNLKFCHLQYFYLNMSIKAQNRGTAFRGLSDFQRPKSVLCSALRPIKQIFFFHKYDENCFYICFHRYPGHISPAVPCTTPIFVDVEFRVSAPHSTSPRQNDIVYSMLLCLSLWSTDPFDEIRLRCRHSRRSSRHHWMFRCRYPYRI
jgi:hypothetical protein